VNPNEEFRMKNEETNCERRGRVAAFLHSSFFILHFPENFP